MQMGFSLKWLLLAVTYAALAAAACSQQGKLWEQFLWLLTGLIVAYSALAACLLSGRAPALGLGFALFALSYGAALRWFPAMSPVAFAAYARGFEDPAGRDITEQAQSRRRSLEYELRIASQASNEDYRERARRESEAQLVREQFYERLEALEASANAIGIADLGLLGMACGAQLFAARQKCAGPSNAARIGGVGDSTPAPQPVAPHPLDAEG